MFQACFKHTLGCFNKDFYWSQKTDPNQNNLESVISFYLCLNPIVGNDGPKWSVKQDKDLKKERIVKFWV